MNATTARGAWCSTFLQGLGTGLAYVTLVVE